MFLIVSFIFPVNVALRRPTWQSSDQNDDNGDSSKAVDGERNPNYPCNSCTLTQVELRPWWAVDLQELTDIHTVSIKNRMDCCCE